MKGLYGKKGFETEIREREERALGDREALVRVHACGVCGTDLHFLRENNDFTPLGHEISAEVVKTGKGVTRVKVGDSVIVEDVTMCGACRECKTGNYQLCRNGYTLGGQPGMSDYLCVHENMLNRFQGMDYVTACMTEPLAVAITCVEKLNLPPFGSLAIFGMGAIGLFCAAYARAMGASRIVMAARNPDSMRNRSAEAAAIELGADMVCYSKCSGYLDEMVERGYFDAAIVAAPPSVTADALHCVKYGGSVLAAGISMGGDTHVNIDVNDMVLNKKALITSLAEPAVNFPLAIELIQSGKLNVRRAITNTFRMEEHEVLKKLYAGDSEAIKTVMVNAAC